MIKRLVEKETVLADALESARAQAKKLDQESRVLVIVGLAGTVLVAARGIVSLAVPSAASSEWLPRALFGALAVSIALQVSGMRRRLRRERLLGRARLLEMARDVLAPGATSATSARLLREIDEGRDTPIPRAFTAARSLARRLLAAVVAATAVGLLLTWTASRGGEQRGAKRWTFVGAAERPADLGLTVHVPESGPWSLEDDRHATGARALVNRAGEPGARPALATAAGFLARDVRATTRCKASSAKATQGCGLVFRFQDTENHVVARVDVATGHLSVVAMAGGTERVLGVVPVQSSADVWHEIGVASEGKKIHVSWNGASVMELVDDRPARSGSVGIWVPAAGEASFDELSVDGSES